MLNLPSHARGALLLLYRERYAACFNQVIIRPDGRDVVDDLTDGLISKSLLRRVNLSDEATVFISGAGGFPEWLSRNFPTGTCRMF